MSDYAESRRGRIYRKNRCLSSGIFCGDDFVCTGFSAGSIGLFLPAMVHFIDEVMERGEAVKGQAVFTMMITLTTIFSSLAGGAILDISGAKMLTFVSSVITAAGALVIFAAVDRIRK